VNLKLDENLPESLVSKLEAQPGRKTLAARVALLFATERVDEWRGCLVVATEHKVRVRRPA
jgi:hypothetical protein